jgi:ABC-2 type transport system ATP-binding protein
MVLDLAIRTTELIKQFDRHVEVNKVELEIQAGEVYALISPNVARTTLIRMLTAAEEPTVGEIYINGDGLLRAY